MMINDWFRILNNNIIIILHYQMSDNFNIKIAHLRPIIHPSLLPCLRIEGMKSELSPSLFSCYFYYRMLNLSII